MGYEGILRRMDSLRRQASQIKSRGLQPPGFNNLRRIAILRGGADRGLISLATKSSGRDAGFDTLSQRPFAQRVEANRMVSGTSQKISFTHY